MTDGITLTDGITMTKEAGLNSAAAGGLGFRLLANDLASCERST